MTSLTATIFRKTKFVCISRNLLKKEKAKVFVYRSQIRPSCFLYFVYAEIAFVTFNRLLNQCFELSSLKALS